MAKHKKKTNKADATMALATAVADLATAVRGQTVEHILTDAIHSGAPVASDDPAAKPDEEAATGGKPKGQHRGR